MLVAVLVLARCGDDDSADDADTDPAAVLADYQATINAGDVDALMSLYADDAVVVSHPQDSLSFGDEGGEPVATGIDEIRLLVINVPNVQRPEDATEFVNVEASGSQVTFDQIWFNDEEDCFGISGNEVTVQNGKITRYVWGTGDDSLCN